MEFTLKVDLSHLLDEGFDDIRPRIREAILGHMRKHPHAADTADGILACWLPRTGYENAVNHIVAVLEEMTATRWLRARRPPDGNILYGRGDAIGVVLTRIAWHVTNPIWH